MVRWLALFTIIGLMLTGGLGCVLEDDGDGGNSQGVGSTEVSLVLEGTGVVDVNETVTITARYIVDYPRDHSYTGEYTLSGTFVPAIGAPTFELVSGEQTWSETVKSFQECDHTIVVRVLKKGEFLVGASVGVKVSDLYAPGANASLRIVAD